MLLGIFHSCGFLGWKGVPFSIRYYHVFLDWIGVPWHLSVQQLPLDEKKLLESFCNVKSNTLESFLGGKLGAYWHLSLLWFSTL